MGRRGLGWNLETAVVSRCAIREAWRTHHVLIMNLKSRSHCWHAALRPQPHEASCRPRIHGEAGRAVSFSEGGKFHHLSMAGVGGG